MEREALTLDALALAMAARNAERPGDRAGRAHRAPPASLDPRAGRGARACWSIAWCWRRRRAHQQTYATAYNPAFSGELRVPLDRMAPMPLDERKVIARRCAFELPLGGVVNLGIGVPEVRGRGGGRGARARLPDADRRARRHRRHAAGRARLRRRGQHRRAAAPEPAVRLLRRRRPRPGVPRHGAGRPPGQRQRQPLRRTLAGAGGFINISQNARKLVFAGTFTAGGLRGRDRGRPRAHRARRAAAQVRRSGRADHLQRRGGGAQGPAGALRHRALRVRAAAGGHGADRGGARHRHRARHPGAHGLPADRRRSRSRWTRASSGRKPMQLVDALLGPAAGRPPELRRRAQHCCSSTSRAWRSAADDIDRVRRVFEALCRRIGHKVALVVNYDGFSLDETLSRHLLRDGERAAGQVLQHRGALHDQRLHAHEARRGAVGAAIGSACLRDPQRSRRLCVRARPRCCWAQRTWWLEGLASSDRAGCHL